MKTVGKAIFFPYGKIYNLFVISWNLLGIGQVYVLTKDRLTFLFKFWK